REQHSRGGKAGSQFLEVDRFHFCHSVVSTDLCSVWCVLGRRAPLALRPRDLTVLLNPVRPSKNVKALTEGIVL
ncbi:MAG: hypothetical protein ACRD3R_14930, partial [Terriglobales bacterium]